MRTSHPRFDFVFGRESPEVGVRDEISKASGDLKFRILTCCKQVASSLAIGGMVDEPLDDISRLWFFLRVASSFTRLGSNIGVRNSCFVRIPFAMNSSKVSTI